MSLTLAKGLVLTAAPTLSSPQEQMQQLRQVEVEVQRLEAENATLEGETVGENSS